MDFEISHTLSAPPERVADVLLDEKFQRSLGDLIGISDRTLLSQDETGGRIERRIRYELDITVSGPAKAFLGDARPAWVEVAVWDATTFVWDWTIEPEVASELLDAGGKTSLEDHAEGTNRLVRGKVKVKVPLYGGKVERWIADGLERAYEEEADRLAAWL